MQDIVEAYNSRQIALIEAGTGTGKTLAYLLPAILWSLNNKERSVISTHTIALQEQLLYKDIPLFTKALNLDIKAVLVKGMSNYLCLRKLEGIEEEARLLSESEGREVEQIASWAEKSSEGSRSALPFFVSPSVWDKVSAERDSCSHVECPHYQECFFFKARRRAQDANLLIVNHHILFADLACRAKADNYSEVSVLPSYGRIIIDEAHHIEEVATDYFASEVSRSAVIRNLGKLSSEGTEEGGRGSPGKIAIIREKLHKHCKDSSDPAVRSIIARLTMDLPSLRREVHRETVDLFHSFALFAGQLSSLRGDEGQAKEGKLRLSPEHWEHKGWQESIVPKVERVSGLIEHYLQSIRHLCQDLVDLKNERLIEDLKNVFLEVKALLQRLEELLTPLRHFVSDRTLDGQVRWIEVRQFRSLTNVRLMNAKLDLADALEKMLFEKFDTIVLCSATLATNRSFDFMRGRLGLVSDRIAKRVTEAIYDAPFDYGRYSLLAVPTDIPEPSAPDFTPHAVKHIQQTIETCRGNALILFTSYAMLKQCYDLLSAPLTEKRFVLFKQGDEQRLSLLNKFRTHDRAVLFGTDSFWEGIDIAGQALRCVIIVKLPFKVPTEPIVEAHTEAIVKRGGNAFRDYAVPNAVIAFKQGFGRLIRTNTDYGCVVCLDKRLITKGYGSLFLNSLPKCLQLFAPGNELQKGMQEFYKKAYHLVKGRSVQ